VGFRYESGRFAGRFEARDPRGGGTGYIINFTNTATEHLRSWYGPSRWSGNRAELGTFWRSEEAAKTGDNDYSTLAIELVK
jgi:hypothetical protein